MGYQQFFRKPQLHRPHTPAACAIPARRQRSASLFLDRLRHPVGPRRVTPVPAVAEASPPPARTLLPMAANLVTALIALVSALILFLLVMNR